MPLAFVFSMFGYLCVWDYQNASDVCQASKQCRRGLSLRFEVLKLNAPGSTNLLHHLSVEGPLNVLSMHRGYNGKCYHCFLIAVF